MKYRIDMNLDGEARRSLTRTCDTLPFLVDACLKDLDEWFQTGFYKTWFDGQSKSSGARADGLGFVKLILRLVRKDLDNKVFTFRTLEGSWHEIHVPRVCAFTHAGTKHMRAGGGLGAMQFKGVDRVGSGVHILLHMRHVNELRFSLCETIFHEICHTSGGGLIVDNSPDPYNVEACKNKALNNPARARTNAENYTLFFHDVNANVLKW